MTEGPLSGMRVVDLTRVLAGPLCTQLLGDLGADVVKVERPGRGDDTRGWGPPFAGGESAYFLGVNRNKRSLTLDLATSEGREVLGKLIGRGDVVVENFKLGTMEGWGFDEGWFSEHAPGAVRCTISGYGSVGPKSGTPGYDFILQAETGLMTITGEPEGQPMKLGVAIVDICAGLLAAIAVLAGVESARRTGRGERVEVNLHDTGLLMLANVASNYLVSGEEAMRYGNGHPNIVPYRTYHASDGNLAVAVGNDAQFRSLAEAIGHPEWGREARFRHNRDRVEHRTEVDSLIGAEIGRRTREEWIAVFEEAGVPSGPINSVAEALTSAHATARGMVSQIEHPTVGMLSLLSPPMEFSHSPAAIRRPPPMLGEHTDEILAELGLAPSDIASLRRRGAV